MSILQLQQQLKSLEASPSGAIELSNCWHSIQLLSEAVFLKVFSDWKILPLVLIVLHILLVCIEQMLKWFELNLRELVHLWRSGTISLGYFSCLAVSILFCHFAQYKTGGLWGLQPKVYFWQRYWCSAAAWLDGHEAERASALAYSIFEYLDQVPDLLLLWCTNTTKFSHNRI